MKLRAEDFKTISSKSGYPVAVVAIVLAIILILLLLLASMAGQG
jgi:hypothetical protein